MPAMAIREHRFRAHLRRSGQESRRPSALSFPPVHHNRQSPAVGLTPAGRAFILRRENDLKICAVRIKITASEVLIGAGGTALRLYRFDSLNTDGTMIRNFEGMQKLGQTNVDSAMKLLGEWNKNWQAIAAEMSDYTKRSFEESTATLEKLMSSKSVEQAVEIQTSYAKRAYDDYMQQVSKIGGMYASMAKEAYKPVEKIMQNGA